MKHTLFALFFALFLAACGKESSETASTVETPSKPQSSSHAAVKTYKAIAYPYTPFVIRDNKGNMSGFEIEILQAIEQKQNIRFEFTPMLVKWSVLFQALENRQGEILSAAMYANPERAERFALSQPYMNTQFVFLNGKNSQVHSFKDLKGKKVAVFQNTIAEKELKALPYAKEIKFELVNSVYEAVKAVMSGKADVAYGDYVVLTHYAKEFQQDGVSIAFNPDAQKYQFVFLINKDNTELLQHINEGLDTIQADGTLQQIQDKWLKN